MTDFVIINLHDSIDKLPPYQDIDKPLNKLNCKPAYKAKIVFVIISVVSISLICGSIAYKLFNP